jgi:hypothetical protein
MAEVKLPIISGDASPREAFDTMKTAGRSGIVVRLGKDHVLVFAGRVADAVHRGLPCMTEVVERRPLPGVRYLPGTAVRAGGAVFNVMDFELPLLEVGPALCFCTGCWKPGSPDGSPCTVTPGCKGTIHCLKIY